MIHYDCRLSKAQELYEQTKTISDQAKQQAQDAYRDSLSIYTEANSLTLPELNVEDFNAASNLIKEEVLNTSDTGVQLVKAQIMKIVL